MPGGRGPAREHGRREAELASRRVSKAGQTQARAVASRVVLPGDGVLEHRSRPELDRGGTGHDTALVGREVEGELPRGGLLLDDESGTHRAAADATPREGRASPQRTLAVEATGDLVPDAPRALGHLDVEGLVLPPRVELSRKLHRETHAWIAGRAGDLAAERAGERPLHFAGEFELRVAADHSGSVGRRLSAEADRDALDALAVRRLRLGRHCDPRVCGDIDRVAAGRWFRASAKRARHSENQNGNGQAASRHA